LAGGVAPWEKKTKTLGEERNRAREGKGSKTRRKNLSPAPRGGGATEPMTRGV